MKASDKEPKSGKFISCIIFAIIAAGTVSLIAVADIDKGSGIMAILFVAFLGAIVAVQVLPGLMLFGMMLKGLASMFGKKEAYKEVK